MKSTKYTGIRFNELEDGTKVYYIRYKYNGKDTTTKVGTSKEGITPQYCKKLRDKTLVQLRLGEDAPIKSRSDIKTLDDVATEYFEQSEARSKGKTESVYNTHLKLLANEYIVDIDADMIESFRRKKSKQISPKTKRVLAVKSVNNILATLSSILHYGYSKKYIKGIPVIKKINIDNTRERFLSTDEIDLLYKTIEDSEIRTKDRVTLFVKLSLFTGGRMGSILSIKGKDINRTHRIITLQNHKTNKTYQSFVPVNLMELIPPLEPQERLIDISSEKQLQRPLQGILNDLFNVGLNPEDRKNRAVVHTLRHTFASHLAINGTPIQTIMKLMDHSDIKMTLKYAKLMPDTGRDEVENLYG